MTDPTDDAHPMRRRYCGAKTRAGGTCRRAPMDGTTRCRLHGGASPQAQRKAAENLAEWRGRRVAELNTGLDVLLKDLDGKRLAALMVKQPGLIARILDLADRFQGGGIQVDVGLGGSVDVTLARLREIRAQAEARKRKETPGKT